MAKSRRASGNQFQDWCAKWIVKQDPQAIVHNQKPVATQVNIPGKGFVWVSKRNDIFGEIDLIAISPERTVMFIQATLDTHAERKEAPLAAMPWNLETSQVQIWRKREDGTVVIKDLGNDGAFHVIANIVRGKLEPIEKEE